MRYFSYVLGFSLLILFPQSSKLLVVPQDLPSSLLRISYLAAQNDSGEGGYGVEGYSPSRGSDRR